MAKVKKINWEAAAKDQVPCYFWDGEEKPEKPFVCRLKGFDEKSFFKGIQIGISISTRHCDFIREEDRLKYTEYEYIGRDNLIAALKECKPIKMRVTPEEAVEILVIASNLEYNCPFLNPVCMKHLYFNSIYAEIKHGLWGNDDDLFKVCSEVEYFPATDTFAQPEKKYRACKDWEEFKPFWGKPAKSIYDSKIRMIANFNNSGTPEWWFENYKLLDGSPIGVEVE